MTVKDIISVFKYGCTDVSVGISPTETILIGEEDKTLLATFGDIVVGKAYIENNRLHLEPKLTESSVVREGGESLVH